MKKNYFLKIIPLAICLLPGYVTKAQVAYGSAGSYGLRLVSPTYTGSAIQVRRTCDNATKDIGFSCGALNTTALNTFVAASNPISAISSTIDAAYSLRKLKCTYAGNAINVRRSCDNTTKDIGFTGTGDLDTSALKTFIVAASPLSALSTAAAAAYALRKLSCAYAGKAINVRRSSDNTTSDIGFTATGDLDTAALKTFVGANDGFVTIWYDQSVNNISATQTITANQPRIVNAGVIDRQNGMPAIRYIGASNMYLVIAQASVFTLADSYVIGSADVATAASNWWGAYRTGGNKAAASRSLANGMAGTITGFSIWSDWGGYAVDSVYVNQVASNVTPSLRNNLTSAKLSQVTTRQTATVAAATYASTGITFGGDAQSTYGALTGYLNEIVFFSSALSQTDKTYMQWSQAQYYNISGLTIATVPAGISSGYVATWYDQSGNGYNLTQGTAANQPRIVNAGVVDRANGNVSVYMNGTNSYMSNAGYNMLLNSVTPTWNAVVYPLAGNASYSAIVSWRDAGATCSQLEVGPGNNWNICWWSTQNDYPTTNGNTVTNNAYQILTSLVQGTASQLYYNGTLSYNNTGQTNTPASAGNPAGNNTTALILGNDACCPGRFIKAYINEIVLSSTNMSTSDRQFLEWTQAQYYNISGPTLAAPPATAASAYITKWYDQSGNGRDLLQATAANQPRIVNAGVINLQGSLPAVTLDGANYYMGQSTLSIANPYTANAIATRTGVAGGASSGYQRLVNISATGDSYGFMGDFTSAGVVNYATFTGNGVATWNDVAADLPATPIALNAQTILSMVVATGATGLVPSINGTALNGKTGTAPTATGFLIGAPYSASTLNQLWIGNISEFNIFTSALSTTRRTLLETNQGAYYGLTPSNLKYTAVSGYNLFVNGVGRTSVTDSIADSRASAGMGIIVGTTATDYLKDDGDYITFGTSCLGSGASAADLPAGATAGYERWVNDWYINKTDANANGGNLQVFFDFSDYGVAAVPANAANYQLWGRANTASSFTVVPTSAVTIVGDRVLFTVSAANLGTTGYYTIGTVNFAASPLPIELLNFSAVADGDKVDVKWETITETNNAYFTVEKSKDGINFTKVIDMPGAGNSTSYKSYAEVDYQPYDGTSYYRLKQTDNNGAYKYFTMVPVKFTAQKNIVLYPNPISNTTNLNVKVSGFQNQEVVLVLRDIQGREFVSKVFLTMEGSEVFIVEETKTLPTGTYIITASSNDKIYNYKLIVK